MSALVLALLAWGVIGLSLGALPAGGSVLAVPALIYGAWDGRRLAGKVSGDTLRRIFAWVLLAVAAFMLIDVIDVIA